MWIVTFAETPQGFFAVDNRPAQTTRFMISIERRHFMAFLGYILGRVKHPVFFEQTFLSVEAEVIHFVIAILVAVRISYLLFRELVDLTVFIENVEKCFTFICWFLGNQVCWPDVFNFDVLCEFHKLP